MNNIFRTNREFYQSFFSTPKAFQGIAGVTGRYVTGNEEPVTVTDELGESSEVSRSRALDHYTRDGQTGPDPGLGGLAALHAQLPFCIDPDRGRGLLPGLVDRLYPGPVSIHRVEGRLYGIPGDHDGSRAC